MSSPSCLHFCSLLHLLLLLPHPLASFAFSKEDCQIWQKPHVLAQDESSSWTSPSGEFAFGFRAVDKNNEQNFLLAVWFNRIEDRTIVWSANGNKPAPPFSEFKLNSNGEYVLNDPNGVELWRAQTHGIKSTCAAILDNGNLVILDENYSPIWESFKEPTDTMLPGQILGMPSILRSRRSETDYADGRFQLRLQTDGNLVLSLEDPLGAYWATTTTNWESHLIFDEAGLIYLKDKNISTTQNVTGKYEGASQSFYYLARIDHDGVFRLYKHQKTKNIAGDECSSLSWTAEQETPDNVCLIIPSNGRGLCGYNSICDQERGTTVCSCPEGYSYLDPSKITEGCKADFPLPGCNSKGWEMRKELVDFVELPNVDFPQSDYYFQQGAEIDKEKCKELCLDDCFCVLAVHNNDTKTCWMKKTPLSFGRRNLNLSATALLKVSKGNVIRKRYVILLAVLGCSTFLNILLVIAISAGLRYFYLKKWNSMDIALPSAISIRSFGYKELEKATGGFTQILGRGAFGTVYKGILPSHPQILVAIKKLDKMVDKGEKEFKTEVSVICQTHHKNLVCLLGYCQEGDQRLLVYEYMSNGSLATFLFGICRPHWNQRVQISFGIARGLMYLHEECSTQIIHCDIKPQNILLDEYFTPRISDFGFAKLLLAEQTRTHTQVRGTVGYFAPEWFRKGSITVKVDVYSFGVMLLEIICCKSSSSFAKEEEEETLIDWAYECYKEKRLEELVENDEEAMNDMERLERLVVVAIWCIQETPSLRPTMKKVLQMLEGVVDVSAPPRPFRSPPATITPMSIDGDANSSSSCVKHG